MWNVVVTPLLTLYWVPYISNFDLLGEFEHVLNKYKLISTLWWVPLFALAAYLISVDVLRRIEILITVMLELNAIRKRLEWIILFLLNFRPKLDLLLLPFTRHCEYQSVDIIWPDKINMVYYILVALQVNWIVLHRWQGYKLSFILNKNYVNSVYQW